LLYVARVKAVASVVRKATDWAVTAFNGLDDMKKMTAAQNVQLASIIAELRPNGGSSLRDSVEMTRKMVAMASARSRYLASNSNDAVYECGADGRCTWSSPALCKLFGLTEAEMMGHGWLKAIKETEVATVRHTWATSITDGIPYECDYTVVHRASRTEWKCHTSAVAVTDQSGKTVGYLGTVLAR